MNKREQKRAAEKDPINEELKEHLERIDKGSGGTLKTARSYYETNRKINIVIVTVGIVLLANSLLYTWYKQNADAWSIFSGGLGITSFATLFFTKPQENITKALGNLAQIQMICKSYCLQFDTILDYHIRNELTSIDEINKINKALQSATNKAVRLVQVDIETNTRIEKNTVKEINEERKKAIKTQRIKAEINESEDTNPPDVKTTATTVKAVTTDLGQNSTTKSK
jgi:hypothetical protein